MSQGPFPDSWKIARVAPIHKTGPTDDQSNYRTTSVLPVVSCLFKNLFLTRCILFLRTTSFFTQSSQDLEMLHSVLTCLLKCTHDWYSNISKGKFTSVTFIDLKKALTKKTMRFYSRSFTCTV